MATPETLLGPAEAVFFQHMDTLGRSGDQQLHDMCQRGIDKIRSGIEYKLTLIPNHLLGIDIDTATSLELVEVSTIDQPLHGVVLVVDIDRMMFQPSLEFQGDLLRTLSLADQFPDHGYERKLTEVYDDLWICRRNGWTNTTQEKLPIIQDILNVRNY